MSEQMVRVCFICEHPINEKVNDVYICHNCKHVSRQVKYVPSYRTDIEIKQCAKCGDEGKDKRLHVHHIDRDHSNNDKLNRIVLCWRCHRALHWGKWKLSDIGICDPETPPTFHGYNLS